MTKTKVIKKNQNFLLYSSFQLIMYNETKKHGKGKINAISVSKPPRSMYISRIQYPYV